MPDRPASSPDSSDSTVIISESDIDSESEECSVLKKKKPKHNWFVIQEVLNRQVNYSRPTLRFFLKEYFRWDTKRSCRVQSCSSDDVTVRYVACKD